jgi:hypothetical protein
LKGILVIEEQLLDLRLEDDAIERDGTAPGGHGEDVVEKKLLHGLLRVATVRIAMVRDTDETREKLFVLQTIRFRIIDRLESEGERSEGRTERERQTDRDKDRETLSKWDGVAYLELRGPDEVQGGLVQRNIHHGWIGHGRIFT